MLPVQGVPVPVPVRLTVCGLEVALSVTISVPVAVPSASGVKETEMMQLAPGARVLPQPLVSEKTPLAAMLERVSMPVPVFWSVTACEALVDPVACAAKVSEAGASVAV